MSSKLRLGLRAPRDGRTLEKPSRRLRKASVESLERFSLSPIWLFKAVGVYRLPFGKGKRFLNSGGLLDAVFGGWQTSAILIRHSATPFNPVMGTANLSGALSGTWYPNRIAGDTLPNPTIAKWFDTAASV